MAFAHAAAPLGAWRPTAGRVSVCPWRRPTTRPCACASPHAKPHPADGWRELEQSWRFQHRGDAWGGAEPQHRACPECATSGVVECRFCCATGVLTLGDKLLCSVDGGTACPVCHGRGETRCQKCAGSGHIASWIVQEGGQDCSA